MFFIRTRSYPQRNLTCWFHTLIEFHSIAFVISHSSPYCHLSLSCMPFSFMMQHIINIICIFFSNNTKKSTSWSTTIKDTTSWNFPDFEVPHCQQLSVLQLVDFLSLNQQRLLGKARKSSNIVSNQAKWEENFHILEFNWLLCFCTLGMRSNAQLTGNTSEKRKSVNLSEVFSFWKYLLLCAELSFPEEKWIKTLYKLCHDASHNLQINQMVMCFV